MLRTRRTSPFLTLFSGILASGGLFVALETAAFADDCSTKRPTDPGGVRGYAYGSAPVQSFATAHIRVWYTLDGEHAVRNATTRADQVPDDVALAATITEEAYAKYGDMKFRPPVSDATHPACVSNGGDGKTDVYLMHFTAADGQTIPEQCKGTPKVCSGFILADAKLSSYKTFEEGVRTVLPHELFHAVQEAYDSEMDGYWSEGTAQWAAKTLAPSIKDLERFLPVFFNEPSRSIDSPPGGSAASYLYATAIWPVFLGERFDANILRETLEAQGAAHVPAMDAVATAITNRKSTLGDEYPLFMVWNTATNVRAGAGGYANAASYPKLPAEDFPAEGVAKGITAGYASAIYRVNSTAAVEYVLDSDPERNRAMLVPVKDGITQVTEAKKLPAVLSGEGFVVISGITGKKSDAPYTLSTRAPSAPTDGGTGDAGTTTTEDSGCATRGPAPTGVPMSGLGLTALLATFATVRRRSVAKTNV